MAPIFEEYGLTIKHIKGPNNETVNALSRIPPINSNVKESKITG